MSALWRAQTFGLLVSCFSTLSPYIIITLNFHGDFDTSDDIEHSVRSDDMEDKVDGDDVAGDDGDDDIDGDGDVGDDGEDDIDGDAVVGDDGEDDIDGDDVVGDDGEDDIDGDDDVGDDEEDDIDGDKRGRKIDPLLHVYNQRAINQSSFFTKQRINHPHTLQQILYKPFVQIQNTEIIEIHPIN